MQFPFAVFVNRNMSLDELESKVRKKMEVNLSADIHKLNIHGIGTANVELIENMIKNLKPEIKDFVIDSSSKYITVTIFY
jgi:hypothetical protein